MQNISSAICAEAVRGGVVESQDRVWEAIGRPGSWWSGLERVEIATQARAARLARVDPPWLRKNLPDPGGRLPEIAVELIRTIAADASKIDRTWAEARVTQLGDAAYVELAAVTVLVCAIDTFADALGVDCEPLPIPAEGDPDHERNEAVADEGAFVPMQVPWQGPNVGRALSLVPSQNSLFMGLVLQMYGGPGLFTEMVWEGTPLSRPQSELLAARVSAVNECFY